MSPENPFKLSANAFEGSALPRIPGIRVKANTKHVPRFEGISQHKQLGFGIRPGPNAERFNHV
jgi:hypothetical protein